MVSRAQFERKQHRVSEDRRRLKPRVHRHGGTPRRGRPSDREGRPNNQDLATGLAVAHWGLVATKQLVPCPWRAETPHR
jgi:hypothetical protein